MTKLFRHGDLRLYVLKLLDEHPRHGYDIILALESRFLGLYSPSPGTVYPRLAALEAEGLIECVAEGNGRKVYRVTPAGREELSERASELKELGRRVATSARELASDIREDVKASVRDLRREVRDAARDVRRDERREGRQAREASATARDARTAVRDAAGDFRGSLRALQSDLDRFASDVLAAARRHRLDAERVATLRNALRDARAAVIEALER